MLMHILAICVVDMRYDMHVHVHMLCEVSTASGKLVKITGVKNPGKTVSILVRGSNRLVIDEADRSLHDALCVVRCLVKER